MPKATVDLRARPLWHKQQAGLVTLPGTNRAVWWTGKVAIGLRYQRGPTQEVSTSAEWIQQVLLQPPVDARH